MQVLFKKYQGLGSDYILLDNRDGATLRWTSTDWSRLCQRRFGVGGVGLLRLNHFEKNRAEVESIQADGRTSEINGIGVSCVLAFLSDLGLLEEHVSLVVNGKLFEGQLLSQHDRKFLVQIHFPGSVTMDKIENDLCVHHWSDCRMVVSSSCDQENVREEGRKLSHCKRFPQGIDVAFYEPLKGGEVKLRHYAHHTDEESVSNLSAGLGAAVAVALHYPLENCRVGMRGGEAQFSFQYTKGHFENIGWHVMIHAVYEGTYNTTS